MVWAIVLLIASVVLFVLAGHAFAQRVDPAVGVIPLLLASVMGVVGTLILYTSGTGNICKPGFMPDQIYTVSGQILTSSGTMAVIEDSKQQTYAVWTGQDNLALPPNAKFVKIDGQGKDAYLIPAEVPEIPAEKPASK